jgi:hypothetical protein
MRRACGQIFEPVPRLHTAASARISVDAGGQNIMDQSFDLNTR